MSIRERLLEIAELNNDEKLMHMRGANLDEYILSLNSFIKSLPKLEEELKSTLAERDYFSFSGCLSDVRDLLIHIHANELAEDCLKLINSLVSCKPEKVEARMTYLLSVLTMLSIDIQMAVYKDEEADEEAPHAAIDTAESWKKSILAVDDSEFFLDAIKRALHGAEYKLTCVNSGMAAMKFLQKHTPDLFILDIEMPEMNGYELAQKIRAYGKKAPIIFLTGNSSKEYVLKAIKVGAADFIIKPITQQQVLERIRRFI